MKIREIKQEIRFGRLVLSLYKSLPNTAQDVLEMEQQLKRLEVKLKKKYDAL